MYAAHAKLKRKEASQQILEKSLVLLQEGICDQDRLFSAILTITGHVRSKSFTADDRKTILQAVGFEFLRRLVQSKSLLQCCSQEFYRSAVLSILSVWTVDPYIAQHQTMRDFLVVVNDVVSQDSPYKRVSNHSSYLSYEQLCRDCEEIVSNMSKHELGVELLLQNATFDLMFQYSVTSSCQNVATVLASLSSIVRTKGESYLHLHPDTFYAMMDVAVNHMQQGQDIKVKTDFARILTSFLTGVSMMEINMKMDWVVKLVQVLQKLIVVKKTSDDSQAILGLVTALVSTAGPQVLGLEITGNYNFLKAVVAQVYVEVYMQLDHITLDNATDRSRHLDRVYKLLSNIVQFVAESGETMDSDTIIVVYRKLVQISDTIMEFVYNVANQEIEFQRNHIVVLMSVRTLAAMLSEITEDVTPRLLELLPFFNFLCQNVEYSDDVVMEVKNLAQAALINIKSITTIGESTSESGSETGLLAPFPEHSSTHDKPMEGSCEFSNISQGNNERVSPEIVRNKFGKTINDFKGLNIGSLTSSESCSFGLGADSNSSSGLEVQSSKLIATDRNITPDESSLTRDTDFCPSDQQSENHSHSQNSNPVPDVCLNQKSIDSFRDFQTSETKQQFCSTRKVSLSEKSKTKHSEGGQVGADQLEQWRPMPNDVLGYLLPAYMCLLDSEDVLKVMAQSDIFQTIVSFIKTSLSHLLENQCLDYPEGTTINALSLIEQIYLEYPASAVSLECLEELFEISILSLPNLLCLPHSPPCICLKLLEVSLSAYRLQGRDQRRKSTLPWLIHSQSRLFKSAINYLTTFYEFQQHKGKALSLHIHDNWSLVEDLWSGCIAGLCTLVRSVDELQDVLIRSSIFPDFLSFLANVNDLNGCSQDVRRMVESLCSLMEVAAESSRALLRLILDNKGERVASKYGLGKLTMLCHSGQDKSQVKVKTVS